MSTSIEDYTDEPETTELDQPRRALWRAWFRRAEPPAPAELAVYAPEEHAAALPSSALRRWAERHAAHAGSLNRRKAVIVTRYWLRLTPRTARGLLRKLPRTVVKEIVPIVHGAGIVTEAYLRWLEVPHLAAAHLHAEAAARKSTVAEKHHHVKSRRFLASLVIGLTAVGGGVWLYYAETPYLLLAGTIIAGILDLLGRRDRPATTAFTPVQRAPFQEGMPLRQLTEYVRDIFAEESIEVTPEGVMRWDPAAQRYHLVIATYGKITDEHLRTLERGLGTADYAITMVSTAVATNKELIIQWGDPLASVPPAPDYEPLSLSINDLLPIGVSTVDVPFAFVLTGARVSITAGSGGGKTKVHMRNLINVLSACHDVWLCGIDLQNGPEFSLWKGVIQKKAITPEEADELLDFLIAEMYDRMHRLNIIAEEDDASNADNDDEWHSGLGPFIFLLVDEFPVLTEYDGKAGRLDLLGKFKTIARLGRKVGIGSCRAAQAAGNQDTGSTVLDKLTSIKIVGPCDMGDTDLLIGPSKRKQGYTPHALKPADLNGNPNDAGKCYVDAGGFGPYVYRGWYPLATAEVKRRARARMDAGLPQLGAAMATAAEVPPALAAVEAALDHYGVDHLPSKTVLEHANGAIQVGTPWTARSLAERLRNECAELGVTAVQPRDGRSEHSGHRTANHFFRSDVAAALAALDAP